MVLGFDVFLLVSSLNLEIWCLGIQRQCLGLGPQLGHVPGFRRRATQGTHGQAFCPPDLRNHGLGPEVQSLVLALATEV